ncbi:hypothetical protein Hdeb2414_s0013g00404441 [Helianthus debilis subsp. tardiflorus]
MTAIDISTSEPSILQTSEVNISKTLLEEGDPLETRHRRCLVSILPLMFCLDFPTNNIQIFRMCKVFSRLFRCSECARFFQGGGLISFFLRKW